MPTPGGLDQLMAETQKKVDIVGTFNAATASGLGADSLSERTAKQLNKSRRTPSGFS